MKKVILTFLLTGVVTIVMAQSTKTVKGAVIDVNGNPLPGAKVEATGGAESTVTDADGTFSLEVSQWLKSLSVTYPGMDKKKMSVKNSNDLIFTMYETNRYWFVNAVAQYNDEALGAGVMFGQLKKWGWYAKAVMDFTCIDGYDDDESRYGPAISAGVIKRVTKSNYLYLGAGYANMYGSYDYKDGLYYKSYEVLENDPAALFELGAIHRLGHFSLNYGVGVITDFDCAGVSFNLGIGYSF